MKIYFHSWALTYIVQTNEKKLHRKHSEQWRIPAPERLAFTSSFFFISSELQYRGQQPDSRRSSTDICLGDQTFVQFLCHLTHMYVCKKCPDKNIHSLFSRGQIRLFWPPLFNCWGWRPNILTPASEIPGELSPRTLGIPRMASQERFLRTSRERFLQVSRAMFLQVSREMFRRELQPLQW